MDKGQVFEAFRKLPFSVRHSIFHFDYKDDDFVFCQEKTKRGKQIQLFKTHWNIYPSDNGQ